MSVREVRLNAGVLMVYRDLAHRLRHMVRLVVSVSRRCAEPCGAHPHAVLPTAAKQTARQRPSRSSNPQLVGRSGWKKRTARPEHASV